MDLYREALNMHKQKTGKIKVECKVDLKDQHDLSLAYSPGVAEPCRQIAKNKELQYEYTAKGNLVAVVSSGTAVLGLGDIGPEAALPVMEGKAVLFKKFAGIDAFPLCVGSKDVDDIVNFVKLLEPTFAGINLEDIAAPECFEIEKRLKRETNMAIFHDDQHGTAIVTLAGLINALKLVNKDIASVKIVVNGAGASATAVTKLLLEAGAREIIVCDRLGALYSGRSEHMNDAKIELAEITNPGKVKGPLSKVINGADVFIGLSVGNILTGDMVKLMDRDPVIFALANPTPEIDPGLAREAGAEIIATGRSDYANQINNVLAFPGVLRGALDVRARDINDKMKLAAAHAIARLAEKELNKEYIIPAPFDSRVAPEVAAAVAKVAMETGVARINISPEEVKRHTEKITEL
ncbi:NAD(P)-dependent malic enzyme [Halothermothrix orenii]|uniref:Malate dehydrogenase (Oxaloacetate-decarboxylating) (NADP(+)) n=1 Tax=Halothermothrix orenii (strain H 168 / OCM 544 / DSM 9562) TaxID=373903 RepID=B8CWU4_HALOH|nr:malic enzyme-like NAD(P)-binding protein [Halothermothrix orenii]ACL69763.1 Malate dehydrogenase (oxaloacetate-decarboxylating) (NADP(+)) [Halothermothrix orenii H 168]